MASGSGFEVAGGDYRMVVAFDWKLAIAFVKFVGRMPNTTRLMS